MMNMEMENNSTANYSGEFNTTEDLNFRYWPDYYSRQGALVYKYGIGIFIFIGLVGNLLCLVLIARRPFRQMSSGVYLLLLAVADLLFCALNTDEWIPEATMGLPLTANEAMCKTVTYFEKFLEQTSSWMVVAITVERTAILVRPRRASLITTRKMAWNISTVIVTVLALINLRQPFIVGIVDDGECFLIKQLNNHLGGIALALLDLLSYSLIPSIILIVCNIILAVKLNHQKKDCLIEESEENTDTYRRQIIAMVIALSIVFVVLTLPLSCFLISDFVPPKLLWQPASRELWFNIVALLVTVNHSTNIFLYILMFRQEFVDIFKCCKCSGKTRTEEREDVNEEHDTVSFST